MKLKWYINCPTKPLCSLFEIHVEGTRYSQNTLEINVLCLSSNEFYASHCITSQLSIFLVRPLRI